MKKTLVSLTIVSALVAIVVLTVDLEGGIILGEPDEVVHRDLVVSLIKTGRPTYIGSGFYYELPGYFSAAALLSFLFSLTPSISLRLVSLLASIFSGLIIFTYLRQKEDRRTGFLALAFYGLIPLTVFYARVGVIEPLLVLGLTGTLCFYDLGVLRRSWRLSFLAGIFLGLSLVTKYSSLPIWAVLFLSFIADAFWRNRLGLAEKYLSLNLYKTLPLVVGGAIFLIVFAYFYRLDPFNVKWQTQQVLGLYGGVKQELRLERLRDFPWWFSWPVLLLTLGGGLKSLWRLPSRGRYLIWLVSFLVMTILVLGRLPFYPRYALVLVPFLAVFSGLAFSSLKISSKGLVSVLLVVGLFNFSGLKEAYRSSFQTIFEESLKAAQGFENEGRWVFSNYWPNFFGERLGLEHYSWITNAEGDFRSFGNEVEGNTFSILEKEGGLIFLENLYADLYLTQTKYRLEAQAKVRSQYPLIKSLTTKQPNFPFSHQPGNTIDLYNVKKP